jgi:hypothetical protein
MLIYNCNLTVATFSWQLLFVVISEVITSLDFLAMQSCCSLFLLCVYSLLSLIKLSVIELLV